jgi:hypothetical protein
MSLSVAEHVRAQQLDQPRSPSLRVVPDVTDVTDVTNDASGSTEQLWHEGLWFEGPLDPRGTLFAALLAVSATVALLVVVTAAVRVMTGA